MLRRLTVYAAFALLGTSLTACSGRATTGVAVGQTRTIGELGEGRGVICPTSSARLDEMLASAKDADAYQEAVEDAVTLRRGDKVRIEAMPDARHLEVSVASGNDAGTSRWTVDRDRLFEPQ